MSTLENVHILYRELLSTEETRHYGKKSRSWRGSSDARRIISLNDTLLVALALLSNYYRRHGELPEVKELLETETTVVGVKRPLDETMEIRRDE